MAIFQCLATARLVDIPGMQVLIMPVLIMPVLIMPVAIMLAAITLDTN